MLELLSTLLVSGSYPMVAYVAYQDDIFIRDTSNVRYPYPLAAVLLRHEILMSTCRRQNPRDIFIVMAIEGEYFESISRLLP